MIRNKIVALLSAAIFCSAGFATGASANEVNTSLAASPTATISTINSIGTPLSNEAAIEVRGEGILSWAATMAVNLAVKAGIVSGSTNLWSFLSNTPSIPSITDYYREFGVSWTTAFMSVTPYWLKPHIVQ